MQVFLHNDVDFGLEKQKNSSGLDAHYNKCILGKWFFIQSKILAYLSFHPNCFSVRHSQNPFFERKTLDQTNSKEHHASPAMTVYLYCRQFKSNTAPDIRCCTACNAALIWWTDLTLWETSWLEEAFHDLVVWLAHAVPLGALIHEIYLRYRQFYTTEYSEPDRGLGGS